MPNKLVYYGSTAATAHLEKRSLMTFDTQVAEWINQGYEIIVSGDLNEEALPVLRGAMNKFLLAELNAIYEQDNNELSAVGTEIDKHSQITGSGRLLQDGKDGNKQGAELDMSVTLTFDNEPWHLYTPPSPRD